jgi:type VII secretion integral membrane protein EccD
MTSTVNGELCRITVTGPERRVDLAVPAGSTVAALIPVLLWHTVDRNGGHDLYRDGGSWVLQRLGEAPFDVNGTPETLDWLDGEELHLRPAEDPLPELDFDDLADGIATVVNRRADRWQPEYRRYLFLTFTVAQLALIAAVLFDRGPLAMQAPIGAVIAVAALIGSVVAARKRQDHTLALLLGLAGSAYAGLTAAAATSFAGPAGLVAGAAGTGVAALVLVLLQRLWDRRLPYAAPLALLATAVLTLLTLGLHLLFGLTGPQAAGTAGAVGLALVVFAPKAVLRGARLRGPQLPRTGDELRIDSQPEPSAVVTERAAEADLYLSVVLVAVSALLPVLFHVLMTEPGWVTPSLVAAMSSAMLLRARTFLGVWQRIPLALAGSSGVVMLVMMASGSLSPAWRGALLAGLGLLLAALLLAALRPWPRRLLPIWEFLATFSDVVTALAVLPLLLQLLGLYAWARGLFG